MKAVQTIIYLLVAVVVLFVVGSLMSMQGCTREPMTRWHEAVDCEPGCIKVEGNPDNHCECYEGLWNMTYENQYPILKYGVN